MENTRMKVSAQKTIALVCGLATGIMIVGSMSLIGTQPASAKPEFAAQTGKPCRTCHQNPAGGGALKPAGQKFKDNGFK